MEKPWPKKMPIYRCWHFWLVMMVAHAPLMIFTAKVPGSAIEILTLLGCGIASLYTHANYGRYYR